MPKNRSASGGPLRSHSRSSSATRLGANLHFTVAAAPNAPAPTGAQQGKKAGGGAAYGPTDARPNFGRANSSGRVHSREQLAKRLAPLQQYPQKGAAGAGKGFSLHAAKERDKDRERTTKAAAAAAVAAAEDEDEWESSESGAATPAQGESGSDTASDEGPAPGIMQAQVADPHAQALAQQQYLEQQLRQQQLFQQQQEARGRVNEFDEEAARQAFLEQQQRQHEIMVQQQKIEQERYLMQQQQYHQYQLQQQRQQEQLALQQQQQEQQVQQQRLRQEQQQRQRMQQQQQQQQQAQQQQRGQRYPQQHQPQVQTGFPIDDTGLTRVNTARPSDFNPPPRLETSTPVGAAQRQPQQPQQQPAYQHHPQRQQAYQHPAQVERAPTQERRPHTPRSESEPLSTTTSSSNNRSSDTATPPTPDTRHSPRPSRTSRPPSSHSMRSDQHHSLRPHPLFRGISHHGAPAGAVKPPPLAPLTVLPADGGEASSASPTTSILDSSRFAPMSASPTEDDEPHRGGFSAHENARRRLSLSSARSTASAGASSLPHSAAAAVAAAFMGTLTNGGGGGSGSGSGSAPWTHDRTRTLSTMSASSSSTALSALVNLPGAAAAAAAAATRPASPQPVAFFPPVNPHANVEAIHPLLPGPYLHNHLTVLARRTPIRESFDRVVQAKNAMVR